MDDDIFSYNEPYGGETLPQQSCSNVVYELMPLLCSVSCVLSHMTVGVRIRTILLCKGTRALSVMHRCLVKKTEV